MTLRERIARALTGGPGENMTAGWQNEYLVMVDDVLAEIEAAGMVLVPRDPTEEDIEGIADLPDVQQHFCGGCKARMDHHDAIRSICRAMLSAAPAGGE